MLGAGGYLYRRSASQIDRVYEEGWKILQQTMAKMTNCLDQGLTIHFSSGEYMHIYTTAYNIISWLNKHSSAERLYKDYEKVFENYITSKILPSLRIKKDESFLAELVKGWEDYKKLALRLSHFFCPLDRNPSFKSPLKETAYLLFYKLVFGELNDRVRKYVIHLIDREQDGEDIDRDLLKNSVNIYIWKWEMDQGSTLTVILRKICLIYRMILLTQVLNRGC